MVVAFLKSEKPAAEYIQREAASSGWKSWIPGMFKSSKQLDQNADGQQDLESIMQNY